MFELDGIRPPPRVRQRLCTAQAAQAAQTAQTAQTSACSIKSSCRPLQRLRDAIRPDAECGWRTWKDTCGKQYEYRRCMSSMTPYRGLDIASTENGKPRKGHTVAVKACSRSARRSIVYPTARSRACPAELCEGAPEGNGIGTLPETEPRRRGR
jgi:hypothetical protein